MTQRGPVAKAAVKTEAEGAKALKWLGLTALAATSLLALASMARAESHETVTVSHAYSNFGEPKYGPDMEHLDYVNVDAPKGGEMSTWAQGNFDSFNPYTRNGVAAFPIGDTESMLTATADDPYGSYCYICTTLEYPESKDWVIFNMREDVTFSDGTPATAEDVAYTFEYIMAEGLPEFVARVSGYVESVEVLDTYRIKYNFASEAPRREVVTFAGGLPVFSKAWLEETEFKLQESSLTPIMGTGPYIIESFDVGRQINYARNPNWWAADHPFNIGRYNFDTMRIEYFADNTAALEAFKAGEYLFKNENGSKDWATGYDFPKVQQGFVKKEEIPDGTIGTAQSFVFNLEREIWNDENVREAARLMFNFEWSNETLFFGLYERVNSFWENSPLEAVGTPDAEEVAVLQPLVDEGLLDASILTDEAVMAPTSSNRAFDRRNLRAASAALDEAGWVLNSQGLREKDGQTLTLDILSFSPAFDRIINPYVENLRRVGFDAKLDRVDIAQYRERRRTKDWDLTTHSIGMSLEPGDNLKQWFASITADDSSRNLMSLRNEAVDRLIDVVVDADTLESLETATHALDRVLRAEGFWVQQWFKDVHTVAYYDMYRYPDPLPPLSLGSTDLWWWDEARAQELRDAGAY